MGTGAEDSSILRSLPGSCHINMELLQRVTGRPELYSGRENLFWADPYVSDHVLHAHLDPDTQVASRGPAEIAATIDFITRTAGPDCQHALDLGCGPGLYARELAARGMQVTGFDVSPASLEYAQHESEALDLDIRYHLGDLRTADLGGPYDLAMQIYGEFGTLTPGELRIVFERVRQALRPGGFFVFDVFTKEYVERNHNGNDWYISSDDGFWQADPHFVIEQTFSYQAQSASVARYTVVSEDGSFRQFSVWWTWYTPAVIRDIAAGCGFTNIALFGSVWGDPLDSNDEWIAVVCRNPG